MILAQKKALEVAHYLMRRYGTQAEQEADLRAQALAEIGNAEAAQIWSELGQTVGRLRRPRRSARRRPTQFS